MCVHATVDLSTHLLMGIYEYAAMNIGVQISVQIRAIGHF